MAQENTNKQTPRPEPIVVPRSRIPRAQTITVTWNGLDVTGTIREFEAQGIVIQRDEQPAIAKTTRLVRHCKKCGDEFPPGAQFCIACGVPR